MELKVAGKAVPVKTADVDVEVASSEMRGENNGKFIKYFSLVFLTLQTTCLVLTMRVSRIQTGSPLYLISTVVVCAEFSKLAVCLIMIIIGERGSVRNAFRLIYSQVVVDYRDTIKVLVPSALYLIQNNLLYVAISNLNAVAYQILYQFKIFTTAFFMVTMLGRRLLVTQWASLVLLFAGIVLSQWTGESKPGTSAHTSLLVGFLAVATASVSSGFAGVYFEKILKGTAPTIWMRNVQLATFGIIIGLIGVYTYDREPVLKNGFFSGYNALVWIVVLLQTCGGLGVAFVMKYADNILKGFSCGLSIILSSLVSYFLLDDFTPSILAFIGAFLVIGATMLYGYTPSKVNTVIKQTARTV
ncbi:unnamed protein product [Calicophoron daubneyi]|uniref:UDP-N-acetylglucosamine transporter n=1 Tax=Calicophoron daubneyi TaxID=300641 RepID=A0AAV2TU23_CALDB